MVQGLQGPLSPETSPTMTEQLPPGKKMGKTMAIVAWLLVLGILSWYFGRVETARYNPNQTVSSVSVAGGTQVTLERNAFGHYVATGEINNQPVTFLVDTGATHVAIPMHLKEKLGLEQGIGVPINTANGRTTAYLTRIPELTLGNLRFYDVQGGLTRGMEGDEVLLGMSVLKELTITQKGKVMILER